MQVKGRRRECTTAEAATRLRHAEAFLTTANLITSDAGKPGDYDFNHVAAGVAVLAGSLPGDVLCCALLGERARGQDHRQAIAFNSRQISVWQRQHLPINSERHASLVRRWLWL